MALKDKAIDPNLKPDPELAAAVPACGNPTEPFLRRGHAPGRNENTDPGAVGPDARRDGRDSRAMPNRNLRISRSRQGMDGSRARGPAGAGRRRNALREKPGGTIGA